MSPHPKNGQKSSSSRENGNMGSTTPEGVVKFQSPAAGNTQWR